MEDKLEIWNSSLDDQDPMMLLIHFPFSTRIFFVLEARLPIPYFLESPSRCQCFSHVLAV